MAAIKKGLRLVGYGIGLSVIGGSLFTLGRNDWDMQSIGAVRFGRTAFSVAVVVVDYKRSLHGLDPKTPLYRKMMSEVHTRSALRLREMCCLNGGCFIKVGQHIGALEYLVPKEYVQVMKVLHNDAPRTPVEELFVVLKEDLKQDVSDLFQSIDKVPLAAASLAQVHRATLKDGRQVAVKIQHPKVYTRSFVDMATMELLVEIVAWIFPEFKFRWLAEETRINLPLELDFVHEAHNSERVAKMFSHLSYLKVPSIHWDMTTHRVLTMEFCEGGFVNDKKYIKDNGIVVSDVVQKLSRLYSEMIFMRGYVHCDPHPGNVLVKQTDNGTQIVLLDHGLYLTLPDEFRLNYCQLWQSILKRDVEGIKFYSEKMGILKMYPLFVCIVTGRTWTSVTRGVDQSSVTEQEEDVIKANAAAFLPQIIEILNDVPRHMLLVFKTNDLLRGIESTLECRADASSFLTMSRCCVEAISENQIKRPKMQRYR